MPRDGRPRIIFVDSVYSRFLRSTELDRKPSAGASYDPELRRAMAQAFGTSDAMSGAMASLGWGAADLISNSRTLQGLWARENGVRPVVPWGWRRGWRVVAHPAVRPWIWRLPHIQGLIQARVEREKPDVLYVHDMELLSSEQLSSLKRSVGLLVGQSGVGLPAPSLLKHYDLFVSSLPSSVDEAAAIGVPSLLLPQAFDVRVLDDAPPIERDIDISFVGSFSNRHGTTERLLQTVGEVCPSLRIFGSVSARHLRNTGLEKFYEGPAWGREMYRVMRRSKIALNRHISLAGPYAANMRMFEATGCGALLLTENRFNLPDYFTPGAEVAVYESMEDAAMQAGSLLADLPRIERMALAGQARTLRDHTYAQRMEFIAGQLEARLK